MDRRHKKNDMDVGEEDFFPKKPEEHAKNEFDETLEIGGRTKIKNQGKARKGGRKGRKNH